MNEIRLRPVTFGEVYKNDPQDPKAFKFVAHGDYSNPAEVRKYNLGIPLWATGEDAERLRRACRGSFESSTKGNAHWQTSAAADWRSFLSNLARGLAGFREQHRRNPAHEAVVNLKRELALRAQ